MVRYKNDLISSEKLYPLIGQNIRQLRQQKDMTQEKLAELVGVDQKYISKIESGKAKPRLTVYLRIANAFQVSIDRLLIDAIEPLTELNKGEQVQLVSSEQAKKELAQELLATIFRYLEK